MLLDLELDEHILNSVLLDLEYRLSKYGKSLSDFPGMPIPVNVSNPYDKSRVILNELSYFVNEQNNIMNHNLPLLNTDQLRIYNIITEAVYDSNGYSKMFSTDGPGGTGKTFLYITLLATVRSHFDIASNGFIWNGSTPATRW